VKAKIMKGLNAWYQVEGSAKPSTAGQCVFWSAHSWSVLPCCSYTAQNAATMKHAMQIAITRGRSSFGKRTIQ
jgi:hypothetical protein